MCIILSTKERDMKTSNLNYIRFRKSIPIIYYYNIIVYNIILYRFALFINCYRPKPAESVKLLTRVRI